VKVLRPDIGYWLGPERFLHEIRIAAGLNHPHIVPVYDSGEAGGMLYYVMPAAQGATLRQRLEREPRLPLDEALHVASDIAEALDGAHRKGVIHRDVKPENILLLEGHAALSDFGIARALHSAVAGLPHTDPGMAIGTPEYMSPESFTDGAELDERADQYSLACVVYEMLAGHPPFTGAMPNLVAMRHMTDAVPPLVTVRPDVPPGVARAVERALAKSPADRHPTVRDFAVALLDVGADAAEPSVAVLPFVNLAGLPEDEPLADGITEEIITALARIEGLRVAPRTSVFVFKGRGTDARTAASQLRVGAVLEGSIRRAGDRLRVSVQLVGARDGYLMWSERYDRDVRDVFAIQDEIAQSVARVLSGLLRDGRGPLASTPTRDVRAYEAYLRGRQYFRQTRKKSLQYAREMFQRALALDPSFALALTGVADCCALLHMYYPEAEADLGLADEASARSLVLAPDLAQAHATRGFVLWRLKRTDEAVAEFERAQRMDPMQFEARYFHARLCFGSGDIARAAQLFEAAARAREDYQARFFAAQSYAALGRGDEAQAAYARALQVSLEHLELNPDDPRAATMCAVSLCRLGRLEEGLAYAARAREIDPDDAGVTYNIACLYALEGQSDHALECLEQALHHGFGARDWIANDPDLASLRDDPRFKALMLCG